MIMGAIIGAVAKFLMPGKDPSGWIVTIVLGIAASWVANFLGQTVGWYKDGDTAGFISSVLGAILLLVIYRAVTGKGGGKSKAASA
jgi:uncharacterized membrane protein YeaQ/YmgE (transglycosylase-associated protein family)